MWQPSASVSTLQQRAQMLAGIRAFFSAQGVMEVDVPVLGNSTVTDPHLQSIPAQVGDHQQYLQTSPEFYMKRLLAAGSGDCYYLGKAFRQDERGRRHRPEFTLLEWYRIGFDDAQLRNEIVALVATLGHDLALQDDLAHQQVSYGDIFHRYLAVNPHAATAEELAQVAAERLDVHWQDTDKSTWLDLLFSHCIEPELNGLVLVYDYPDCQCALAKLAKDAQGQTVAKRFEVFWNGMELANGYWELTDAREQLARFEADNRQRREMGLSEIAPDKELLAALKAGLPDCAGVALGVDRLLMCLLGADCIDEVLPF